MRRLTTAPTKDQLDQHRTTDFLQTVEERFNLYTGTTDPTVDQVPSGQWLLFKNTTTGSVKLWTNDAGTLKSMPLTSGSGQVLQQVVFNDVGSTISSGSFTNITASTKLITPKSSNSTIVVSCSFTGVVGSGGAGTNTAADFQLYYTNGTTLFGDVTTIGAIASAGTAMQLYTPGIITSYLSNTDTVTKGFLMYARYTLSPCSVSAGRQTWIITEIQN